MVHEGGDYGLPNLRVASAAVTVRVLWAIKGLGPGGAESLLVNAARVHDTRLFDVQCAYVLPHKHQNVAALEEAGVRCHCLGSGRRDLRWPLRLRRLLAHGGFDVVHFHSPLLAGVGRLAALTVPRSRRPALVTTEHNTWSAYSRPTRWLNRLTSGLDARAFAVSEEAAQSMQGRSGRRVQTLLHGIDVAGARQVRRERDEVRRELGLRPDDFVVGTVANYRQQKDYPNLLQATALAAQQMPELRLVAVGQGPLAEQVEADVQRLGLQHVVTLTGYRADAIRVMAAFDVFTLASLFEGLPVALMEAFALGLPVVSTAVGGVAEVLRDETEALLVPTSDPAALARAWSRVAGDHTLRDALAEASRAKAELFDIRRAVAVLEAAYIAVAPKNAAADGVRDE